MAANMYPRPLPDFLLRDPKRGAERKIYFALEESLDSSWDVFYRVSWIRKDPNSRPKDGEIDFVLCHPDSGILVLEVKGGGIRRDGQTGVWSSIDRDGQEHRITNPVDQTLSAMYNLRDKVREQKGWGARPLDIGRAIAFPDSLFNLGASVPDIRPDFIIDASNMEDLARKIASISDFWKNRQLHMPIGKDGMDLMRKLIASSFELRSPLGYSVRAGMQRMLKLTEEQFQILYTLGRVHRAGICGGAGTGKTVLALEKARRLASEGFDVLLTCVSGALRKYLQERTEPSEHLSILTFEELCSVNAVEASVFRGRQQGESETDYLEKALPGMLLKALETLPPKYDAIIVDEGQDFHDDWWDPIQFCLKDLKKSVFYVFYDDNQNVYRRSPSFPADVLDFPLSINFRNSQEIHRLAKHFYRGGELQPKGPEGRPPEIFALDHEDDLVGTVTRILHRLIVDDRIPPEDIAILSPLMKEHSPVFQKLRCNPPARPTEFERRVRNVLFESIPHFKGLERSVILLCEIDHIEDADRDFMFYTGVTRACAHLVLVGTGKAIKRLGLGSVHLPHQKSL